MKKSVYSFLTGQVLPQKCFLYRKKSKTTAEYFHEDGVCNYAIIDWCHLKPAKYFKTFL